MLHPAGNSVSFVIWNDTHDRCDTLTALHEQTSKIASDFLSINGEVSNAVYSQAKAVDLYLNTYGLPLAQNYPLMFSRGNPDGRGVAARELPRFVVVPDNEFYCSFRQGPPAVLVMDTGEDKSDSHPVYAGLNDFEGYRTQQRARLEREIAKPEFRNAPFCNAPFRVLFCHLPLWWKDDALCADGRQKWHDLLVIAKIQMVILGHTHQNLHLPPVAYWPYRQLVDGGPQLERATIIQGQADNKKSRGDDARFEWQRIKPPRLQSLTIGVEK